MNNIIQYYSIIFYSISILFNIENLIINIEYREYNYSD